jgi:hypothetical protein
VRSNVGRLAAGIPNHPTGWQGPVTRIGGLHVLIAMSSTKVIHCVVGSLNISLRAVNIRVLDWSPGA